MFSNENSATIYFWYPVASIVAITLWMMGCTPHSSNRDVASMAVAQDEPARDRNREPPTARHKTVKDYLSVLPQRYITFRHESIVYDSSFDFVQTWDTKRDYAGAGKPGSEQTVPGEIPFFIQLFHYPAQATVSTSSPLVLVSNERYDGACFTFDTWFLQYVAGAWKEVTPTELFDVDPYDLSLYYTEKNLPDLYQRYQDIDHDLLIIVSRPGSELTVSLYICDQLEGSRVPENEAEMLWQNLISAQFKWNQDKGGFALKRKQ